MRKLGTIFIFLFAAIIVAGCSSATSPGSTGSAGDAGASGGCPARWTEDVCGQPCAPVGTNCWYDYDQNPTSPDSEIGDAYFCKTREDDAGVSKNIWVCGV